MSMLPVRQFHRRTSSLPLVYATNEKPDQHANARAEPQASAPLTPVSKFDMRGHRRSSTEQSVGVAVGVDGCCYRRSCEINNRRGHTHGAAEKGAAIKKAQLSVDGRAQSNPSGSKEPQSEVITIFMDPSPANSDRSQSSYGLTAQSIATSKATTSEKLPPPPPRLPPLSCKDIVRAKHTLICDLYLNEKKYAAELKIVYDECYEECRRLQVLPDSINELLFGRLAAIHRVSNKFVKTLERLVPASVLYSGYSNQSSSSSMSPSSSNRPFSTGHGYTGEETGTNQLYTSSIAKIDVRTRIGDAMCSFLTADMYAAYERYIQGDERRRVFLYELRANRSSEASSWLASKSIAIYRRCCVRNIFEICLSPANRVTEYASVLRSLEQMTPKRHRDFEEIHKAHLRVCEYLKFIEIRLREDGRRIPQAADARTWQQQQARSRREDGKRQLAER